MSSSPQAAGSEETRVSIVAGPLVGPVLRRVVGMLAARADLPLDRLDDAVLVADVIASRAGAYSSGGEITVAMLSGPRTLAMSVGPLCAGGAHKLVVDSKIPDIGNVIERLADEVEITGSDDEEYLRLSLAYAG